MGKRHPAAGMPPQETSAWTERCITEAAAYVTRVCGPGKPSRAVARALAEIAGIAAETGNRPKTAERVRAVVRDAALSGDAERWTKPIGGRLRRLSHARRGCADVPALLLARAAGELSTEQLATLHTCIDHCSHCAALTARVDAAEWRLQTALDGPADASITSRPARRTGEEPAQVAAPPATQRSVPAAATASSAAVAAAKPAAAADPAPARGAPPLPATAAAVAPDRPAGVPDRADHPSARPAAPRAPVRRHPATANGRRPVSGVPAASSGPPPGRRPGRGGPPTGAALPTIPSFQPGGRRREGRRAGRVLGAVVVVAALGAGIAATGLLDPDRHSPRVVLPLSRHTLPAVPVTSPSGGRGGSPLRSSALVLGSAQSQRLIVDADQLSGAALLGRRAPAVP